MTASPVELLSQVERPHSPVRSGSGRWILNSWLDQLLIVSSPLLIIPLVFLIDSPLVGVKAETISLIVVAFGALGHHFPGMIRAYGDPELFQRFRWRFILVPLFLFGVFFPLYHDHRSAILLTVLLWACWHGLMQLYGFVRIYDAKVGSVSRVTAYWDWLLCLCWFSTAQLFSDEKMSALMEHWYNMGGPLVPPGAIPLLRGGGLGLSLAVLMGFLINYTFQTYRGTPPNPVKLLMLTAGIGCWWFAVVFVKNILLGVAVFEVFHDVQYLAIVWLYNCRRVSLSSDMGSFMRFVFRRGMLLLYVGLVFAYGLIGLVPNFLEDGTLKTVFMGILWTSTILHYYYDGFIWKVREKSTRSSLGLSAGGSGSCVPESPWGGVVHTLKWSPLIALVAWILTTDLSAPTLAATRIEGLKQKYTQQLLGSSVLPANNDERSWLYTQFKQVQNIAQAIPDGESVQLQAAIMLANFGRNDEAIKTLETLLKRHPSSCEAHQALGEISLYRGNGKRAINCFQSSLACATTSLQRSSANLKQGEAFLREKEFTLAKACFQAALKDNPRLKSSIDEVTRKLADLPKDSP